jgi:uncharacterized protein YcbX
MQGERVPSVTVGQHGVVDDRRFALIDESTGHVMSGKRYKALMLADATDDGMVLPDGGPTVRYDDPEASKVLSEWLGRSVRLARPDPAVPTEYEMTFDPPNDDAEYFTIPTPTGSFVDLAHVHLLTTATLEGCRAARPDLDWDVRRFRPNIVVDVDGPPFIEDTWTGSHLRLGDDVELDVLLRTVRCAMPLRAQPGLDRQPELFQAMTDLNTEFPNHLGVYCTVRSTGEVAVGDAVEVSEPDG